MADIDVQGLVKKLVKINPETDSVDDYFQKIGKRTTRQKFFGWIFYLLTFTFREKNPQLDRAACKAAECAETVFKGAVTPEFKQELVNTFTKLLTIIQKNDGSKATNIESLIRRIQNLRPVADEASKKPNPEPPQVPQSGKQAVNATFVQAQIAAVASVPKAPEEFPQPGDLEYSNKIVKFVLEAPDKEQDQPGFDPNTLQNSNYKSVLDKLSEDQHPNRDKALLKLMSTQVSDDKCALLIETLLTSHRLLLARNFDSLNPKNRKLNCSQALSLIGLLGDLADPALTPLLASYAAHIATFTTEFNDELIYKHIHLIPALFDSGNVPFQVHVAYRMLWRLNERDPNAQTHLSNFGRAPEAWKIVADMWPVGKVITPHDVFKKHFSQETLVAFINALAAKPKPVVRNGVTFILDCYSIGPFVKTVFEKAKLTGNLSPLFALSPDVFPYVNVFGLEWVWFLKTLQHPEQEHQKRWLVMITKAIATLDFETQEDLKLDKQLIETLTKPQILELVWADYPRWLSFPFALKSETLPQSSEALRRYCQALDTKEQQKILTSIKVLKYPVLPLVQRFIDLSLEGQPPLVQKLMIDALSDATVPEKELQKISYFFEYLNFSEIPNTNVIAQKRLLSMATPAVCRRALNSWGLHLKLDKQLLGKDRNLIKDRYPLGKIIESSEDPDQLAAFFLNQFGDSEFGNWLNDLVDKINDPDPKYHPDNWAFLTVLCEFEKYPWKLRTALLRLPSKLEPAVIAKVQKYLHRYGLYFPKVKKILQQYPTALNLINEIKTFVAEKTPDAWVKAWKKFNEPMQEHVLDEIQDFIVAHFRHASLEGLAYSLPSIETRMEDFFIALMDDYSFRHLVNVFRTGHVSISTYQNLLKLLFEMDKVSPGGNSPVARFIEIVYNHKCFGKIRTCLANQFYHTHLSDLPVMFGEESLRVHSALVLMDPFFKNLPIRDNAMQVPPQMHNEASLRIKCLYGVLNEDDLKKPETNVIIEELRKHKISLTGLADPPPGPGVVTLKIQGNEIRAYRFMLACSWPYFESIFRPGMPLVSAETLTFDSTFNYQTAKDLINGMYNGMTYEGQAGYKKMRDFLYGKIN